MKNHTGDAQPAPCKGGRTCGAQAGCVAFLERGVWRHRPGHAEAGDPLPSQLPVPAAVNRPFTPVRAHPHFLLPSLKPWEGGPYHPGFR